MSGLFEQDLNPGHPKILFIGLAQSTHTHAWIDLLEGARFNVRLFAVSDYLPPSDWPVKMYVSASASGKNNGNRQYFNTGLWGRLRSLTERLAGKFGRQLSGRDAWLANVIKVWKPDIIHTLGLFDEQGGWFYYETRHKYHLEHDGTWVLQLRGGSDMALRRHNPEYCQRLQSVLSECDQILCDNYANISYARELGIPVDKFASIVPVPGTGGIDVDGKTFAEMTPPSKRERIILWPKAYESQWSKALPVLEAIQTAWNNIQPCKIYMLAISPDVYEWFLSMPEEIRKHCQLQKRISRQEVLSLMGQARILLAPSLVDGVPNSLYEAMAHGAFPIISPLETITPVVIAEENVLFARNLYPDEIANALIRAMNDDVLLDSAAERNLHLVRKIANRSNIRNQVKDYYQALARRS